MNKKIRRVKLNKGEQRKLMLKFLSKYGSIKNASLKLKIPYSTLKKYTYEEFLIPEPLFDKAISKTKIDKNSINFLYLDSNWGKVIGGKRGIKTLNEKYKSKISEWRRKAIRNLIYSNIKKINIPDINEDLAEFIGIYLGDGTMTKYFIRITGDYRYDIIYLNYVSDLCKKLFNISGVIKKEKKRNTVNLVIYSKNICFFLKNSFGLKYGNKIRNKSCIPNCILSDPKLYVACLRGLVDTDGSISRRGRNGSQFCVDFASHNPILLNQVYNLGKDLGIFTYKTKNTTGTNKWENILKYFKVVGSSHPKHIVRFYVKYHEGKVIYLNDVPNYMSQDLYRKIRLPFKMALLSNG